MQALLYFLTIPFIFLVSILPFPVLYILSDIIYVVLYYLVGYRRDVVYQNLRNAFPEKSELEILQLRKGYYRYLCDLFVESIKTRTIRPSVLQKRCTVKPEAKALFDKYYSENKNLIVVMGHFGNWEWAGNAFSLMSNYKLFVVYHPLSNKYFNRFMVKMRTRFGTNLITMKNTLREILQNRKDRLNITTFIADQTPLPDRAYWTKFLNQETPVYSGTEKISQKMNYPVIYVSVKRVKRGYYQIDAELLFDKPELTSPGEITEAHIQHLANDIQRSPETWLWSHRRWKHKRNAAAVVQPPRRKKFPLASAILYYLVMLPLSRLPFGALHTISTMIYFFLFRIFGYRKKVVSANLANSFPEKNEAERRQIMKRFYRHLCDVLTEGIKAFSISKDDLREHLVCKNPELIRKYYDEGKSVIIAVGHYNSWELFLTGINLFIRHRAVVIYQPLRNLYLDKKLREKRSEYRTIMLPKKDVKAFFKAERKELSATVFAIDQSPPKPENCHWMTFLHQDTGVLFGTEKYAKEFDQPVVYARLNKIKRGYYSLEFSDVTSSPRETAHGEITEKVTRLLEKDIIHNPQYWLWSHKRWKHKRPAGK